MVIDSIAADPDLRRLMARLASCKGVVHASGLWGSSAPLIAAVASLATVRTYLYVTAHLEEADDARDDIELFSGRPCTVFPAWESLPGEGAAANEIQAERLRVCNLLQSVMATALVDSTQDGPRRRCSGDRPKSQRSGSLTRPHSALRQPPRRAVEGSSGSEHSQGKSARDESGTSMGGFAQSLCKPGNGSLVIVAPIQALMQPVPIPKELERNTIRLKANVVSAIPAASDPEALIAWAIDRGFTRLDLVESPGDVARRGDIVDLFVPGENNPYRVQFDGCRIESIRRFDISTQRSLETLEAISVTAMPERFGTDNATTALFDYVPADALVVLDDPPGLSELGRTLEIRLGTSDQLFPLSDVLGRAAKFSQLHLSHYGATATADEEVFDFHVVSTTRFEGDAATVVAELRRVAMDHDVHVFCDTDGERQRLMEMLAESGGDHEKGGSTRRVNSAPPATGIVHRPSTSSPSIFTHVGMFHRGFEWTATKTVFVGHHELFQRHRTRRQIRRMHAGRPLESWLDLKPGEFVVHVSHGIAVYRGLTKLQKGDADRQEEFLTLEFAEKAVIHVPCSQIDLVQKYIGAGGRRPQLSTLGGKRWGKMKQQVADAVSDLAESLLRVQATRERAEGTAYPADTDWQREFEAAFPYEETEDQLAVAGEIRGDLTRPRPMDRVVCGDVGYGKTELAMRASFKIVEYGRQVAVLVPTTVLAEQHFETFRERMAEYPFTIGCLSRFRSSAEQKKILDAARKGRIDVVIGTHRLLSKDVAFADLGLVVIDEEQRFGVEHKERLKAMRETVDVLTLTATPIPRTLHMALVGIRDISSLQTPPVDRRAISTYVRPFDRSMIRDAILRELNRDGQVFFVHNFVQSIAAMADTVRSIVPEARAVYAHGQMKDEELEDVIHRFGRRQADILVTTTIIESGIDMPSVNTIFINRAERFGLADLHQLRGRVGRSSHRAYCYLLLSPGRPPTDKAAKRLKTIEEFSELGAGFRIAMRDLEIRGAGNLLGSEQSGHIAAVGYEMYCRLLEQTVRRLKNEPDPTPPAVQIDLQVEALIPRSYILSDRLRIETYRRLASCQTASDLLQLERDVADAFGPPPQAVLTLLELAEIRVHARKFGIQAISLRPPDIVFIVEQVAKAEPLFANAPGTVRVPDARTIHLRLPPAYLERRTLLPVMRKMFIQRSALVEALK